MTEEITEAVAAADEEAVVETQEAEGAEAEEGSDQQEPEKVSRTKERREQRKAEMARLRASEAEASQRLAAEQARLDRIRDAAAKLPEPKESDFQSYDDYRDARAAWASVRAIDGRTSAEVEAEIEQRRNEVEAARQARLREQAQSWNDHVAEARGRFSDFDAVVFSESVPITERVAGAIMETHAPADVAYRIAQNPALARELSAMSDLELGRELGRIESQLSRPRPRTETNAPPPISPVKPAGNPTRDPDKMSAEEYRAYRASGGTF